jgi:ribonuclease P protein component
MAMARLERLTRRAEFLKVAEGRRKFVAPGLILQAAAQPAGAALRVGVRVGFTASRKVGNAVARNRARRRLRAASAALLPDHAAPGHDYVLIARGGTLTRGYPALLDDLADGLKRLGLYRA